VPKGTEVTVFFAEPGNGGNGGGDGGDGKDKDRDND
jgi:hypothetical protein